MATGSLMKVKVLQNAPRGASAILLTCIKRQSVLKTIFGPFESGHFTQVLLYSLCNIIACSDRVKF